MSALSGLLSPDVKRHLLVSEREFVVDHVTKHWVTRVPGALLVLAGSGVWLSMGLMGRFWWLGLLAGLALGLWGFWKIHAQNMDRFVVTNMRVFRVHGILNQHMASVPLARLLDITLNRPPLGLMLGYGHFVFETAAQEQGLKRIAFVPEILRRELTLQTVIQRAGVRARAGELDEYADLHASSPARPPRAWAGRLRRLGARSSRPSYDEYGDDGT